MNRRDSHSKAKRKAPGHDKDVRTAHIYDLIGRAIGVNLAPNYLKNCHPTTVRTFIRQKKARSK